MAVPLVFISYVREDRSRIVPLGAALRAAGLRTWIDVENLIGGERWETAIERALAEAQFIIVCLSRTLVQKRGFAQREIRRAVKAEEEMLPGDIFLLPVRFDDCEVPVWLAQFQYIDASAATGFAAVVSALVEGSRRRSLELPVGGAASSRTERPRPRADLSDLGGRSLLDRLLRPRPRPAGDSEPES